MKKSEDPRQLTERSGGRRGFQDQYVGGQVKEGLPPGWDCSKGRWPTNTLLCHTPDCRQDDTAAWDCADGCPVKALDEQSGERPSGIAVQRNGGGGVFYPDPSRPGLKKRGATMSNVDWGYADSGGASRFYPQFSYTAEEAPFRYVPKASRSERDEGVAGTPAKQMDESRDPDAPGANNPNRGGRTAQNFHPTVKPLALMRWLVRLVTHPGGTVLDPFTGSGTTGCAAMYEGMNFIGIEREPEYKKIAGARIARHAKKAAGGPVASPGWVSGEQPVREPVAQAQQPPAPTAAPLTLDDLFGL